MTLKPFSESAMPSIICIILSFFSLSSFGSFRFLAEAFELFFFGLLIKKFWAWVTLLKKMLAWC